MNMSQTHLHTVFTPKSTTAFRKFLDISMQTYLRLTLIQGQHLLKTSHANCSHISM